MNITKPHHNQVVAAPVYAHCLTSLISTDFHQNNPVEKFVALSQILENFQTLMNMKFNHEEWLNQLYTLRYIVTAIEEAKEAGEKDFRYVRVPDYATAIFNSGHTQHPQYRPPFHVKLKTTEVHDSEKFVEKALTAIQDKGITAEHFMQACLPCIEVILEENAESGLTHIGNLITQLLVSNSKTLDVPDVFPEVEIYYIDNFGSLDDDDPYLETDWDSEDSIPAGDLLKETLNESIPEAVIFTAKRFGYIGDEYDAAVTHLVDRLDLDSSVVGEDPYDDIMDVLVDTEEDMRAAENLRLEELQSRCHEAFLVTLMDVLSNTELRNGTMYRFDRDRILSITNGNELPVYDEFYTNVLQIIATFAGVGVGSVRLVLEKDCCTFMCMDKDAEATPL